VVSQLCGYEFQEQITVGIAWSSLVHAGIARSSNILVPSAHSVAESPSQEPEQTCDPYELVGNRR